MAKLFRYFDKAWRTETFKCPDCGWVGNVTGLVPDLYEQLVDYSCPTCDRMIIIVSHPTVDEVREAAAEGNEEAMTTQERAKLNEK